MINFSIIIPHFNIPNLLVRCLRSIPIREDIQVIVVDDCTPGWNDIVAMTPELRRPFLEEYSTKKGGSAGRARNVGLSHALGTWISFIDADDFFSDKLNLVLNSILISDADIVFARAISVFSDNVSIRSTRHDSFNRCFDEYSVNGNDRYLRYCFAPIWGKFFKREMIEKYSIVFDTTRYSNDVYFSFMSGYYAKFLEVNQNEIYILTERNNSLAFSMYGHKRMSIKECRDRFWTSFKVKRKIDNLKLDVNYSDYYMYLSRIKSDHKLYYIYVVFMLMFVSPKYAICEIIGYFNRKSHHYR